MQTPVEVITPKMAKYLLHKYSKKFLEIVKYIPPKEEHKMPSWFLTGLGNLKNFSVYINDITNNEKQALSFYLDSNDTTLDGLNKKIINLRTQLREEYRCFKNPALHEIFLVCKPKKYIFVGDLDIPTILDIIFVAIRDYVTNLTGMKTFFGNGLPRAHAYNTALKSAENNEFQKAIILLSILDNEGTSLRLAIGEIFAIYGIITNPAQSLTEDSYDVLPSEKNLWINILKSALQEVLIAKIAKPAYKTDANLLLNVLVEDITKGINQSGRIGPRVWDILQESNFVDIKETITTTTTTVVVPQENEFDEEEEVERLLGKVLKVDEDMQQGFEKTQQALQKTKDASEEVKKSAHLAGIGFYSGSSSEEKKPEPEKVEENNSNSLEHK